MLAGTLVYRQDPDLVGQIQNVGPRLLFDRTLVRVELRWRFSAAVSQPDGWARPA